MKKLKRIILSFLVICVMSGMSCISTMAAESTSDVPSTQDNLSIGLRSTSYLVATSSGYMRVFYNGEKICVEYYDDNFNVLSKKSISMELSLWGGFYATSDAYYVVEGKTNTDESDTAEVIRVIKYSTAWKKMGAAKITSNPELFGGEVRTPFRSGCVEMTEYNGTLYVVTGHEGYVDSSVGQGHQGFLMIAVDESTMTGSIVDSDFAHSFAQYIEEDDSYLYVLEQSEGGRCTELSKYDTESLDTTYVHVLEYGGTRTSSWAIACYASVDDMALSSDNVLCLGTSIDQSLYDDATSSTSHNIYLTVTSKSDFSTTGTTVKWLTDYEGDGKSFYGTKITKINDNRFLVTWEEYVEEDNEVTSINDTLSSSILHYVFVDGDGNKISKEFTAAAPISDCHPIVKGSKIVYYASSANMVNFYTINANTGAFSKKVYRAAGENATWVIKNGVLTISGTGAINIDTEANYRFPVSSTTSSYVYSSSDNAWKGVRASVNKIVISKGITSIPDNEFEYFSSLNEVVIKSGLKSIGKEAFSCCRSLSKITIPSTVKSIGEDFLWTGYYWISDDSHVTYATVYAPYGSYAIKYAKANNISYTMTDCPLSKAKISGFETSYAYVGNVIAPSVTVKFYGETLEKGTDYTVSYKNNKNIGKATITITGKGNYTGTVTKTFKIVPKATTISSLTTASNGITVKWSKATAGAGYKIYRSVGNGKYTLVKTISNNATTSWKDTTAKTNGSKYRYKIITYKTVSGTTYTGSASAVKTTYFVSKPKLSSLTNTKGLKLLVKWGKNAKATGYQIQYSTSSSFSGAKTVTVTSASTTSKTIGSLTKGKKYYVRIRSYKTVGKVKYYSAWSDKKAVTISK